MNYKLKDYLPKVVEFAVSTDDDNVPETFGEFKDEKEASDFIHKNLTGINEKISTLRFMDNFEKKEYRKEYSEILELKLPILEKEIQEKQRENERTKKELKTARENYTAAMNEIKEISNKVRDGRLEIHLDDKFTWRVPYNGKYYFFTLISGEIKLAKLKSIPEHEKEQLFNDTARNEDFFKTNFGSPGDEVDEKTDETDFSDVGNLEDVV
jgi:DNA gyrase/topoisomerase IV subunit A